MNQNDKGIKRVQTDREVKGGVWSAKPKDGVIEIEDGDWGRHRLLVFAQCFGQRELL